MMKFRKYIFISLTLLVLGACKKDVRPSEEHSERIEFGIPLLEETKAAFKESADDLADGFSVFAIKYTEDSDTIRFMNNVKVSRTDGVWNYEGAYYWSPMAYHSFYAFYPYCDGTVGDYIYGSSVENANLVITPKDGLIRTGTNTGGVTDILYGFSSFMSTPFDVSQPVEKVVFTMKHVFSSVKLNLINRSDYKITAVSGSITGSDGTLPGLYDAVSGLVINADETIQWNDLQIAADPVAEFSFNHTGMNLLQGDETAVFEELVIPQNINTSVAGVKDRMHLSLSVDFGGMATPAVFTVCLADIELDEQEALYKKTYLPGKRYEYNLNVTSDYITCSVDLVEWTDDDMIDL